MIAKKISYKNQKSKFNHVRDVYNYIHNLDNPNVEDKVLFTGNFNINSSYDDEIIAEIADLAEKSVRSKNPICHWILSLKENEHFTPEIAKKITSDFLESLGYSGCQVSYAVHGNTRYEHIHLLINRVDPLTKKCVSRTNDMYKSQESVAQIQKKYSLSAKNHERYVEDIDGKYTRVIYTDENIHNEKLPEKSIESEIRSGEKSAIRIAKEKAWPVMQTATTWSNLHSRLAKIGFSYELKGGGAVLKLCCSGETTEIKASAVAKKASLKNMENKLGAYVPSEISVTERTSPEPIAGISLDILNEYKSYKNSCQKKFDDEEAEKQLAEKKESEEKIKKIKQQQKNVLVEIEALDEQRILKKAMILAYRDYFSEQIKNIKTEYEINKHKYIVENKNVLPFNIWLQDNKSTEINVQNVMSNIQKGIYTENYEHISNKLFLEKYNTLLEYCKNLKADSYKISAEITKNNKTNKLILRMNSNQYGYTQNNITNSLPTMIRLEQNGYEIFCEPISKKYSYLTIFDDISKNSLSQLKKEIEPNFILESDNKIQFIYRIPKTSKYIIDRIKEKLYERYISKNNKFLIDKQLVPCYSVKFSNVDTKINRLLIDYIRSMKFYYNQKNKHNEINELYKHIFNIHANEIIKNNKTIKIDNLLLLVAIRLRAIGYTQLETAKIIEIGNKKINRNFILKKVVSAFSKIGNYILYKMRNFIKKWKLLEYRENKKWFKYKNKFNDIKNDDNEQFQNNNLDMR